MGIAGCGIAVAAAGFAYGELVGLGDVVCIMAALTDILGYGQCLYQKLNCRKSNGAHADQTTFNI